MAARSAEGRDLVIDPAAIVLALALVAWAIASVLEHRHRRAARSRRPPVVLCGTDRNDT